MNKTIITLLTSVVATATASAQSVYSGSINPDSYLTPNGGNGAVTFNLVSGPEIAALGSSYNVGIVFSDSTPTSGAWSTSGLFRLTDSDSTGAIHFGSFISPAGYTSEWDYFLTATNRSLVTDNTIQISDDALQLTADTPIALETINALDILSYTGSDAAGVIKQYVGTPDSFLYDEGTTIFNSLASWRIEIQYDQVPEPSSTALLGLGVLGMLIRRKR